MNRLVIETLILILVALNSERTPELADQVDEQIGRLRAALAAGGERARGCGAECVLMTFMQTFISAFVAISVGLVWFFGSIFLMFCGLVGFPWDDTIQPQPQLLISVAGFFVFVGFIAFVGSCVSRSISDESPHS